jgi:hypothetical protein
MNQENFIYEILNSTNGITKVDPNDLLFSRIQRSINNKNKVSTKWIWVVAAFIVLLVSLNVALVISNSNTKISDSELLVNSIINNNQLYN